MISRSITLVAACLCTQFAAGELKAGEPLDPSNVSLAPMGVAAPVQSAWESEAVLYGWFSGMEGDTGYDGQIASVDLDFSDVASNLDFAAFGAFGAHNGTWGFLVDGMYLKVSTDAQINGPLFHKADISVWSGVGNFYGSYRLVNNPRYRMDVVGGARVMYSKTKLRLQENLAPSDFGGSESNAWVDAIIGIRGSWDLTERVFFNYHADVGGGSSDLTWQGLAAIGYRFNDRFDIRLAYRYIHTDYEKGDKEFVYDMKVGGPQLGVGISW